MRSVIGLPGIAVLGVAVLLTGCSDRGSDAVGGGAEPNEARRPDVILVTLDTTRFDHLGVYGYERDITPSLDRFARASVTFRRAWATGAWTLPTHASMITGRYPSNHGAHFDHEREGVALSRVLEGDFFAKHKASRLPEDEITLAELLRDQGYATAAFTGGPWLAPPFGLMQGYQVTDTEISGVAGRSAEDLTERCTKWLESVPRDEPVHVLVNYFDPHTPYEPPPGYDDLPGARIPMDPEQDQIFINGGRELSEEQRRAALDRYDGEIRYMDHHFGRLIAALERLDRFEDALIIVVGDHGELFGEHGVMGHGRWLYEGVLRVPLLVHHPGEERAGSFVDAPVSQVDLLPMVAQELGIELPEAVDGRKVGERTKVLAEAFRDPFSIGVYGDRYDRDLTALIRWPWKLITSDTGQRELYDLRSVPAERSEGRDSRIIESLERDLAEAVSALGPKRESTPPANVPPELRENLRRLGYIE